MLADLHWQQSLHRPATEVSELFTSIDVHATHDLNLVLSHCRAWPKPEGTATCIIRMLGKILSCLLSTDADP